ncbi:MAG: MarR family transcriptional regulator [Candidatus Dormiibacterota bacterium]
MTGAGGRPADGTPRTPAEEIAAAWNRERPGTPTSSIPIATPIRRLAKLFTDDRQRVLARAGVDDATLDLLSVLRRSGPPYRLSTRELTERTLVTAGAISQRVARAEREGLVTRQPGEGRRRIVLVTLTGAGHRLIEATVDLVLHREASLLAGLAEGERDQLAALLDRLLADVRTRSRQPLGG